MDFSNILTFLSALFAGGLALAVLWRERHSLAHWVFAALMLLLAGESLFTLLGADAVVPGDILFWQQWRHILLSLVPGTCLLFSLTYARGNFREFLTKWRVGLFVAFLLPLGLAILFRRGVLIALEHAGHGSPWLVGLGLPGFLLYLCLLISSVLVLMNLERTFRAAVGTMRWRIKFMVLGLGVLFVARAYTSSQALLFRSVNLGLQSINSIALLLACVLLLRSLWRPGLFDPNIYPSHSILQNSFTVILAGIYLIVVGVLARIVTFLGGDASFALKSFVVLVALVLLSMLLLSDRVRLYGRRFVSRHFQKPLHDYRTVWRRFTEDTARRVEEADLCNAVVKLVSDIFQALSVTIWLADSRQETLVFAASSSVSGQKAEHLKLDPADAAGVITALRNQPAAIDIDSSKEAWAVALRRMHPDEFRKGGNRVCVPLHAGGELIGALTVGDRVGAVTFSLQDFDLLKSVSDQAASSLLNIRLSKRLTQATQLEAFQAMSAFFVHDLKNTASTLSLMLQNLPVHFNDPAFREDALRGISKTVTHINDLIRRLSQLRNQIAIQPVQSDLNQLIVETLNSLTLNADASTQLLSGQAKPAMGPQHGTRETGSSAAESLPNVSTELRSIPKLSLDRAQIQNVLTNLVLNARDAVGGNGQIRIETGQRNGSVLLTISDTGCGMTPEFIQNSLFRPFQTTKKQGIGIGMFQCKMIIEAHHGRIEVESEIGKGTTFGIVLPVVQNLD